MNSIAFCGVDCAVCPDFLSGKCPDCRKTTQAEGDACLPAACCLEKGFLCCGDCESFPCSDMADFYAESEGHRQALERMRRVAGLRYVTLRQRPELRERAAAWFHDKWGVPEEAYLECMDAYLAGENEYGWYLCLDGEWIIGGMGVIENDFHDRKDLAPNICAVYTEEDWRGLGVAGRLLNMTVEDLRSKGVSPVYLVTDHTGFYEQYGWDFFCLVQGDGEPEPTRMYIHR
jgi:GNAT superfamily N-acetyltransferase